MSKGKCLVPAIKLSVTITVMTKKSLQDVTNDGMTQHLLVCNLHNADNKIKQTLKNPRKIHTNDPILSNLIFALMLHKKIYWQKQRHLKSQ